MPACQPPPRPDRRPCRPGRSGRSARFARRRPYWCSGSVRWSRISRPRSSSGVSVKVDASRRLGPSCARRFLVDELGVIAGTRSLGVVVHVAGPQLSLLPFAAALGFGGPAPTPLLEPPPTTSSATTTRPTLKGARTDLRSRVGLALVTATAGASTQPARPRRGARSDLRRERPGHSHSIGPGRCRRNAAPSISLPSPDRAAARSGAAGQLDGSCAPRATSEAELAGAVPSLPFELTTTGWAVPPTFVPLIPAMNVAVWLPPPIRIVPESPASPPLTMSSCRSRWSGSCPRPGRGRRCAIRWR